MGSMPNKYATEYRQPDNTPVVQEEMRMNSLFCIMIVFIPYILNLKFGDKGTKKITIATDCGFPAEFNL
jgi:hypothetical protein